MKYIVLFLSLLIVLSGCVEQEEIYKCQTDEDCAFWNTLKSENPCPPCDFNEETWVCMVVNEVIQKNKEQQEKYANVGICAPCPHQKNVQPTCECVNNICKKTL
jgi:hypothetical protein